MAKTELIEHFGGEFGVTVVFTLDDDYNTYVEFRAAEITGRSLPDNEALYEEFGAHSSMDTTNDPKKAARYFEGSVKWDGCSHLYFGEADNEGYLHLCGREDIEKLSRILAEVYERCGELMLARGCNVLGGEFQCFPATPSAK